MPKVRTLSRTFLKGHPRAGEPTYFMEKVYNSLYPEQIRQLPKDFSNWHFANQQNRGIANEFNKAITETKHHTIRMGRHFKANDELTLAVWRGKPYHSMQVKLWTGPIRAADILIHIDYYDDRKWLSLSPGHISIKELAKNDGLELMDFIQWLNLPVGKHEAQILIWNPEIEY